MSKPKACDVFSAAENVSDLKKDFICVNDDLHQAMLDSPLAIVIYAVAVLFVMFLVRRASAPIREEQEKNRAAVKAAPSEKSKSES